MARSTRKQRKIISIVAIAAGVLLVTLLFGKDILTLITGPTIPGYAKEAPAGEFAPLEWPTLQKGEWEYNKKPRVEPQIAALGDKKVKARGFLLPVDQVGEATQFFLAEKPGNCYFCNPPKVSEVIGVNLAGGKKVTRTDWPVTVYGTFKVATGKPNEKELYVISDAEMVAGR